MQSTGNPSRRAMLAGFALAPVAGLPVTACPAGGDDAELLTLHRQLLAGEAGLAALVNCEGADCGDLMKAPLDLANDACDRLEVLQARTLAGLQAKADAIRWAFELGVCSSLNHNGKTSIATINEDGEWHERLAWSLARDVLAMGRV